LLTFANGDDINRQSIVFYDETPDVFYCPQDKPVSLEGMIVKAKPFKNLCEYKGRPLPEDYKSDCWNDVDETEFACSEKKRIQLKLKPPGSDNLINAERAKIVPKNRQGDYTVKRLDPDTKDGRPARFLDAEDVLEADLLKDAIKQEKSRRDRKPKHDF
jgi:ATP-dependent DNA helicase 2 subunit 2